MPTDTLSAGQIHSLVQNQVYALPPVKVTMFVQTTASTFEQSNTVSFAAPVTVVIPGSGQVELAGGFLRLTSAATIVTIKRD